MEGEPEKTRAVEISAVIAGHNRHADKSVTLRLRTILEAPVPLATWFDERKDCEVVALIADDVQSIPTNYKGKRDSRNQTPSQRLRNGIFRYWKHLRDEGREDREFPQFYDDEMNKIITQCI